MGLVGLRDEHAGVGVVAHPVVHRPDHGVVLACVGERVEDRVDLGGGEAGDDLGDEVEGADVDKPERLGVSEVADGHGAPLSPPSYKRRVIRLAGRVAGGGVGGRFVLSFAKY